MTTFVDRKIPAQTNRAHLSSTDPRCDTVTVLNIAARRAPGRRFADMNAVVGSTDDWNLHYARGPEANHFTHRINPVTKKLERMPESLRRLKVNAWTTPQIKGWRKNVGTAAKPKWVRPFTCVERQAQAKVRRVIICWELKSSLYRKSKYATRLVLSMKATRWTAYYMTLVTMPYWAEKLTAFRRAGGQTAIQPHGAKRPANFNGLHPDPIQRIWGHFS